MRHSRRSFGVTAFLLPPCAISSDTRRRRRSGTFSRHDRRRRSALAAAAAAAIPLCTETAGSSCVKCRAWQYAVWALCCRRKRRKRWPDPTQLVRGVRNGSVCVRSFRSPNGHSTVRLGRAWCCGRLDSPCQTVAPTLKCTSASSSPTLCWGSRSHARPPRASSARRACAAVLAPWR